MVAAGLPTARAQQACLLVPLEVEWRRLVQLAVLPQELSVSVLVAAVRPGRLVQSVPGWEPAEQELRLQQARRQLEVLD